MSDGDKDMDLHLGDPAAEFYALSVGAGVVDLSNREVVSVSGPDRLTWLTTLSSQVVDSLQTGESRELLLMDAQGHIDFAAGIIDVDSTAYLLVDQGQGADLVDFLERMKFMLRVEIALEEDIVQLGFIRGGSVEKAIRSQGAASGVSGGTEESSDGKRAPEAGECAGGEAVDIIGIWDDPWPGITEGGTTYCEGDYPDVLPQAIALFRSDNVKSTIATIVDAAKDYADFPLETDDGYPVDAPCQAGLSAWEAIRINQWRPRFGTEVDAKTVPHELDWLRTAVHLNKGCYCGQETVARIINLGRPPRRMIFLSIDGSTNDVPVRGAQIVYGKRPMGVLTSVAYHQEDGWIGLGVVRRAASADDDPVIMWEETNDEGQAKTITLATKATAIVSPSGKSKASPQSRPGQGIKRLPGASGKMPGGGFGLG